MRWATLVLTWPFFELLRRALTSVCTKSELLPWSNVNLNKYYLRLFLSGIFLWSTYVLSVKSLESSVPLHERILRSYFDDGYCQIYYCVCLQTNGALAQPMHKITDPKLFSFTYESLRSVILCTSLEIKLRFSKTTTEVCDLTFTKCSTSNPKPTGRCFSNVSDLLWEKIVLVIEKNFWNSRLKAENLQKFWDH